MIAKGMGFFTVSAPGVDVARVFLRSLADTASLTWELATLGFLPRRFIFDAGRSGVPTGVALGAVD
jgi:hypothetical protein